MEQWKAPELTEEQKTALAQPFFSEKKLSTTRADVIAHLEKSLSAGKVPEEQKTFIIKLLSANLSGDFAVELPEATIPPAPPAGQGAGGEPAGTSEKDEKISAMEEELTTLKTELASARKTIDDQLDSDINKLGLTIKAYDTQFDANKFLEGITDKNVQKKLLLRQAESVKRINPNPIEIKLSAEDAKKKINEASKNLFGQTMEDFFKDMGIVERK